MAAVTLPLISPPTANLALAVVVSPVTTVTWEAPAAVGDPALVPLYHWVT